MTFGSFAAVVLAGLGLFVAVVFGVVALRQLSRVRKTPPLGLPAGAGASADPSDPANDVPTMRFKGEDFERDWQGSRGYARPESANVVNENWTDRLIIPVVTPLRPSRFSDPAYWTRYLPGVFVTMFVLFVVLPLLIVAAQHSTSGAGERSSRPRRNRAFRRVTATTSATPGPATRTVNA